MKTLPWLFRREFWENKGGFFWAPIVAGGLFVALNFMVLAVASAAAERSNIQIGLMKFDTALSKAPEQVKLMAATGIDVTILMIAAMIAVVTAVVVFFYSLGALYDDRRDRSVLFWKSLPISDRDTVLSKAISALLLAPSIGMVAGILTGLATVLVVATFMAFHGQNFFGIVFFDAHPIRMTLLALATVPVAALWALPTVGWLMLCSAWARSKPFLWAVGVPVGAGIVVSWFDLMQSLNTPDSWFWKHVVARALLGVMPASWMSEAQLAALENVEEASDIANVISFGTVYATLGQIELWVGAAIGVAMLIAATRLRRWRDEA
jgi:ABC-2 type transport system permease protein